MKKWLADNNLEAGTGIPPAEFCTNNANMSSFVETIADAGLVVTLDRNYCEDGSGTIEGSAGSDEVPDTDISSRNRVNSSDKAVGRSRDADRPNPHGVVSADGLDVNAGVGNAGTDGQQRSGGVSSSQTPHPRSARPSHVSLEDPLAEEPLLNASDSLQVTDMDIHGYEDMSDCHLLMSPMSSFLGFRNRGVTPSAANASRDSSSFPNNQSMNQKASRVAHTRRHRHTSPTFVDVKTEPADSSTALLPPSTTMSGATQSAHAMDDKSPTPLIIPAMPTTLTRLPSHLRPPMIMTDSPAANAHAAQLTNFVGNEFGPKTTTSLMQFLEHLSSASPTNGGNTPCAPVDDDTLDGDGDGRNRKRKHLPMSTDNSPLHAANPSQASSNASKPSTPLGKLMEVADRYLAPPVVSSCSHSEDSSDMPMPLAPHTVGAGGRKASKEVVTKQSTAKRVKTVHTVGGHAPTKQVRLSDSPASKASSIVRNACTVMDKSEEKDHDVPIKLLPFFHFLNETAQRSLMEKLIDRFQRSSLTPRGPTPLYTPRGYESIDRASPPGGVSLSGMNAPAHSPMKVSPPSSPKGSSIHDINSFMSGLDTTSHCLVDVVNPHCFETTVCTAVFVFMSSLCFMDGSYSWI